MNVVTVTPPTASAVSLAEAKEQVVVTGSAHDTALQRLISASERMAEQYLNCFISERTVDVVMDAFPTESKLKLPVSPIQSVTSVSYVDESGDAQTLTEDTDFLSYLIGQQSHLATIDSWPATRGGDPSAVTIRLLVGYEDGEVPEDIKHAILLRVTELFEMRQESSQGSISPSFNTMKHLLATHRRHML